MNNLSPQLTNQFDQIWGTKTPTNVGGKPVSSRADEIRKLAQSNTPAQDQSGGDAWLPMTDSEGNKTESPLGTVLKGVVGPVIETGKDTAAAIGASAQDDNQRKVLQADQDAINLFVTKRNEAQKSGDKVTYAHFDNLIKNYKTVNGQSATDVFPELNKSNEQVIGDFAGTAVAALSGGALEGAGAAAKAVDLGDAIATGSKVGAGFGAASSGAGALQNNESAGDVIKDTFKGGVVGALTGAATGGVVHGASSVLSGDAAKAVSEFKNKVAPSESADELTGKVLQGKTGDIESGKSGLANLDTSKVKTYNDLESTADSKIKELSKSQDTELSKDTTPKKVQQLAVKVGDQEASHNYVLDAVSQLKNYYEKTNDILNLNKIKAIEAKLDPVNGGGVTVKELNDLAKMHGSDLNGYNANGELASGLTKQAAENTRQGLKSTVRSFMTDKTSQQLDKQISDLYTVRDLSRNMTEKVNTLSQRLQKPNILQKFGAMVGKIGKFSGIKDFAQELLGIDKIPGAKTFNAVELQNNLRKNLDKLNAALGKDDGGFMKDIVQMWKDLPNKQGGFVKNPFADTQRDTVVEGLSKLKSNDFVNKGGKLNTDAFGEVEDILSRAEKGKESSEDLRRGSEILAMLKKI